MLRHCRREPLAAGAQDRIFRGESTFLVEMRETAALLRHSTPASLLVRLRAAALEQDACRQPGV
jgi:hypothetical protein